MHSLFKIPCSLFRWISETGHNEESVKSCLNETFVGNMFLFGFKLNSSLKARSGPVSLDDVNKWSSCSQTNSKSTSLIAYQMLYPNDIIQRDSQTLFEKLKYNRLVAMGRVMDREFIPANRRNCDSFIGRKSFTACLANGISPI